MSLQEYVSEEMLYRLILRMDIMPTPAGTDVEAELINYWSDEEGACVIVVQFSRIGQKPSKIEVGIVTQAFMMERRKREIATYLQPIMTAWENKGWASHRDKFFRVAQPASGPNVTWETSNPLNILVVQDVVRLQSAVEHITADPEESVLSVLCGLPAGESLLVSELKHTLKDASRKLGSIIKDANRQFASITQL